MQTCHLQLYIPNRHEALCLYQVEQLLLLLLHDVAAPAHTQQTTASVPSTLPNMAAKAAATPGRVAMLQLAMLQLVKLQVQEKPVKGSTTHEQVGP